VAVPTDVPHTHVESPTPVESSSIATEGPEHGLEEIRERKFASVEDEREEGDDA
jgi:hypothetical protein